MNVGYQFYLRNLTLIICWWHQQFPFVRWLEKLHEASFNHWVTFFYVMETFSKVEFHSHIYDCCEKGDSFGARMIIITSSSSLTSGSCLTISSRSLPFLPASLSVFLPHLPSCHWKFFHLLVMWYVLCTSDCSLFSGTPSKPLNFFQAFSPFSQVTESSLLDTIPGCANQ